MSAKAIDLLERSREFNDELIMIVDDTADDTDLMRTAFHICGVKNPLQILHDGREARNYFEGLNPYGDRTLFPLPIAMLTDLKMPHCTGFELLEWMRSRLELRHIVRIVVTSSISTDDMDRAFALGANFFLTKPGTFRDLTRLVMSVMKWLRLRHYQNASEPALLEPTHLPA